VESAIALARLAIVPDPMDPVKMSTNVRKESTDNLLADLVLNVSTVQDVSIASVQPISPGILIKVFALLAKCDASLTRNAEPMKDAFNLANVFARHLTTPTPKITTNVKVPASVMLAESTANVLHPIRPSVCASRDTLAIPQLVAVISTNAETILAVLEPCASTKMVASSAVVPADNLATPIRYILLSFYFIFESVRNDS
jgi:hypothetical protein